jgi:sulfate adenylyltransferase subunit 1
MDLVDFSKDVFDKIVEDFQNFTKDLNIKHCQFIPISALIGQNVVAKNPAGEKPVMDWYSGPTLLDVLETTDAQADINHENFRFPVQYVIRVDNEEMKDFRGFAGQIASGVVKVGDELISLPSKQTAKVKAISTFDGDLAETFAPNSVTLVLDREIDTSRGDVLTHIDDQPEMKSDFSANICWMTDEPLQVRKRYLMKHGTTKVKAMIMAIDYRLDTDTLKHEPATEIQLNEIAKIQIKTLKPLAMDNYASNRATGSFILIDEITNSTVAAAMISS